MSKQKEHHLKSHYVGEEGIYPGGRFHVAGEDAIDVYDSQGEHQVALRKNGAGMWSCESEAHGLPGRHNLSKAK